jgi:hypothetical protein
MPWLCSQNLTAMGAAAVTRVIVVGALENLFQRLPEVTVVEGWPDARQLLASSAVRP